jgi:hypothetical protein
MIVYLIAAIAMGVVASFAGAPAPVAAVIGLLGPLLMSAAYLRLSGRDVPTRRLDWSDPRSSVYLSRLATRLHAVGVPGLAAQAVQAMDAAKSGALTDADTRYSALIGAISRSPRATDLIALTQRTWRESGVRTQYSVHG